MAAASTSSPATGSIWRSSGWRRAGPTCCCSKAITSPRQFSKGVGATRALQRVAKNGLRPEEFAAVPAEPDAAEFVYVGELSTYKGVDTLIEALALLHCGEDAAPRLVIVGSGCEYDKLAAMVELYGLNRHVAFYGVLPAREAFALGASWWRRSRAESLPYIVHGGDRRRQNPDRDGRRRQSAKSSARCATGSFRPTSRWRSPKPCAPR